MRYRLIKSSWADISGPTIYELEDPSLELLQEKNKQGYNIYFFPNHNSKPLEHKFMTGRDIDIFNYVFVDMDLKDGVYSSKEEFVKTLLDFEVQPSLIVDSGNGVHAYWRIQDLDREKYIELQIRLIKYFNTDKSVWTVLQLMRCPNFYNVKEKDNPKLCSGKKVNEVELYFKDLDQVLPPISQEELKKAQEHINRLDGIVDQSLLEDLEIDELPEKFQKLLEKDPRAEELFTARKGKRSEADMALTNLLFSMGFSKKEAIQVLVHTSKAREKGARALDYAVLTVSKVYESRVKYTVPNISKMKKSFKSRTFGERVYGPDYLDNFEIGWRKSEVFGLVGGSGVGKTALSLNAIKSMIENNPSKDDIYIFFSLEMAAWEIIERWEALTGGDSELDERLFIVSNEDEEGNERHINLQKIYWFCEDIRKSTGKEIGAIVIDHVGVIDPVIDISKRPNFNFKGEGEKGNERTMKIEVMLAKIKELAKKLNTFIILQSQTTKEKAGNGDNELGLGAAFGTARFEWYVDYLVTIWQPLRVVEDQTDLRVLAFQYAKVRNKRENDTLKTFEKYTLKYNPGTGELSKLTLAEKGEFDQLMCEVTKIKKEAKKGNEAPNYKLPGGLKRLKALTSGL